MFLEHSGEILYHLGVKRVGKALDDQANDVGGILNQAPGDHIWSIPKLFNGYHDFRPGFFRNTASVGKRAETAA